MVSRVVGGPMAPYYDLLLIIYTAEQFCVGGVASIALESDHRYSFAWEF